MCIATLLRPRVASVMLGQPSAVSGRGSAKTDKLDARSLAWLLARGFLDEGLHAR